ncbi:hypothetical protein [Maricaulis sp.]
MPRFERMTWQSSARLVALASWVLAIALTGGMGWQAWTAIQETNHAPRYGSARTETVARVAHSLTDAQIIAQKDRVVR